MLLFCFSTVLAQTIEQQEAEARDLLRTLEPQLQNVRNNVTEGAWAYTSNITDYNLKIQNDAAEESAKFLKVSTIFLHTAQFKFQQ